LKTLASEKLLSFLEKLTARAGHKNVENMKGVQGDPEKWMLISVSIKQTLFSN